MSIEDKLKEMGIELQPSYSSCKLHTCSTNRKLNLSIRTGPRDESGNFITGKVGSEISADEAYELSRNTAVNLLSAMNLSRISRKSIQDR